MARDLRCESHGPSQARMICSHLCEGSGLGFYRVEPAPSADDYETALCEACDELLWAENGRTEEYPKLHDGSSTVCTATKPFSSGIVSVEWVASHPNLDPSTSSLRWPSRLRR
jgi:hypothetical protein